ncbi:MAG: glycosyl hydrolase [Methylorubrum populi]
MSFIGKRSAIGLYCWAMILALIGSSSAGHGQAVPFVGSPGGAGQYYDADVVAFDETTKIWGFTPDFFMFSEDISVNNCSSRLAASHNRGLRLIQIVGTSKYTLEQVRDGAADAAIITKAKCYNGHKDIVRVFHEMNGNYSGNWGQKDPSIYIAAFRHVAKIFKQFAPDIQVWWTPNVWGNPPYNIDPQPYYPGDDYVDTIGLDGYTTASSNFAARDIFSNRRGVNLGGMTIPDCFGIVAGTMGGRTAGTKPLVISELGVDNRLANPGAASPSVSATTQAAWMTDLFAWLSSKPFGARLTGINYWNRSPYTIRDGAALSAFRTGVAKFRAAYR